MSYISCEIVPLLSMSLNVLVIQSLHLTTFLTCTCCTISPQWYIFHSISVCFSTKPFVFPMEAFLMWNLPFFYLTCFAWDIYYSIIYLLECTKFQVNTYKMTLWATKSSCLCNCFNGKVSRNRGTCELLIMMPCTWLCVLIFVTKVK